MNFKFYIRLSRLFIVFLLSSVITLGFPPSKDFHTPYPIILNQVYGITVLSSPLFEELNNCISARAGDFTKNVKGVLVASFDVLKKAALSCLGGVKDSLTPPECLAPWKWYKCGSDTANTFRGLKGLLTDAFSNLKKMDITQIPYEAVIQLLCSLMTDVALAVISGGAALGVVIASALKKFDKALDLIKKIANTGGVVNIPSLTVLAGIVSEKAQKLLDKLAVNDPEKLNEVLKKCSPAR